MAVLQSDDVPGGLRRTTSRVSPKKSSQQSILKCAFRSQSSIQLVTIGDANGQPDESTDERSQHSNDDEGKPLCKQEVKKEEKVGN